MPRVDSGRIVKPAVIESWSVFFRVLVLVGEQRSNYGTLSIRTENRFKQISRFQATSSMMLSGFS
jgi:hypothetical protein